MAQHITLRSYRSVFRFERRLHRRIPVRGGLPLRTLLYAPLTWGAVLAASQAPGVGWMLA